MPDTFDTPFPLTAAEARARSGAINMARGREARAAKQRAANVAREAGEQSRLEQWRAGKLPFDDWTDDELSHGRPTNRDGSYGGIQPKFTPREHASIRSALLRRGEKMLESYYMGALKVLEEVASGGESEPSRVKAANLIIERTAGRTVEKIEIKSSDPWQDILDEVLEDEVLERMTDTTDA